jgi:hypothetical protein
MGPVKPRPYLTETASAFLDVRLGGGSDPSRYRIAALRGSSEVPFAKRAKPAHNLRGPAAVRLHRRGGYGLEQTRCADVFIPAPRMYRWKY